VTIIRQFATLEIELVIPPIDSPVITVTFIIVYDEYSSVIGIVMNRGRSYGYLQLLYQKIGHTPSGISNSYHDY